MNAVKLLSCACAAVALSVFAEVPQIDPSDVTIAQDSGTRLVTIDYALTGCPGIVTVDIQTNAATSGAANWLSIGAKNFNNVHGDVNMRVTNTTGRSHIYWQPMESWPNHRVRNGNFRAVVTVWATNAPPDYMVVDLVDSDELTEKFDTSVAHYYTCVEALPHPVTNDIYKTKRLVMRKIPAAEVTWRMGSPSGETGRGILGTQDKNVEQTHYVTLSSDYYMAIYETTKEQYRLIRGDANLSGYGDDNGSTVRALNPIEYKTYSEVTASCQMAKDKTGVCFTLPTEAQWEYACRAGTGTGLYTTNEITATSGSCPNLNVIAWYTGHLAPDQYDSTGAKVSKNRLAIVGLLQPNAWGLYDMYGNVMEYCSDLVDLAVAGSADPVRDPTGLDSGGRCARGGSWYSAGYCCRSAARSTGSSSKTTGFRMCAPAVGVR